MTWDVTFKGKRGERGRGETGRKRVGIWKRKGLWDMVKHCSQVLSSLCSDWLKNQQELHYFGKRYEEKEGEREYVRKVKSDLLAWYPALFSLQYFPAKPLLCPLSFLPPNNVLLIISPWLACLRGWALRPGPLMGICDAPKSLLKWPTGELQGG